MDIEDLIRQANPVRPGDVPAGDSPHARSALGKILRDPFRPAAGRARRSRRAWLPTLAFMAAGAAVAIVVSLAQGAPPRPSATPARPAPASSAPRPARSLAPIPHSPAASTMTARQVLLLAADHATAGLASGRYWRVTLVGGTTFPGGTKANPYDITVRTSADQWNPSSPGGQEWVISQQLGARPATPADAAAWRAAGAPASWHSGLSVAKNGGWLAGYPVAWVGNLAATTAASAPTASGQVSDGTVGYVEGDLTGLKAAQLAAMPTTARGIAAVLRQYYKQLTYCAQHPGKCSTQDQIIWAEAVMLLGDPISRQARAATLRVMAALPGVKVLGLMTDPLGRTGYALTGGQEYPNPVPANFNPLNVILIDPGTGSVLATEELGPVPRTLHCLSFDASNHCSGPAYYGRSYAGQANRPPGLARPAAAVALTQSGWPHAARRGCGERCGPPISSTERGGPPTSSVRESRAVGLTSARPPRPPCPEIPVTVVLR
jgi:hypothetical protein